MVIFNGWFGRDFHLAAFEGMVLFVLKVVGRDLATKALDQFRPHVLPALRIAVDDVEVLVPHVVGEKRPKTEFGVCFAAGPVVIA